MAKRGFFKDESQKEEFLLFIIALFWLLGLFSAASTMLATTEVSKISDQSFWFTLQDPGGGSLSYPFICILYLKFLHLLSGENILLFMQIAAFSSFLFFLASLFVLYKMGISPKKIFLLSFLVQPLIMILLLRIETVPIFLSILAFWLFHSGKRMEGWLALLAGAFFKVFPIFFAPLFLAMELKNFSRSSALRLIAVALISLLAFSLFPENMRTVIFNSARGIQVESIYSNILLVGEYFFGLGISIELNYGAHQLVLPAYAEALPQLALGIQVLSVFALSALFFLKGARKEELFVYAFLVATAMILFSKVFSTQFMLWPLIFAIPIFAMPWGNPRIQLKLFPQAAALYLSAAAAYFAYPVLGYLMVELSPLTLAALTAKNVLLFAVFAWVFLNRENFFLKED